MPTDRTVNFTLPLGRGRGVPRPYRAVVFYCPVGRGDPTPPCDLPVISHLPGWLQRAVNDRPYTPLSPCLSLYGAHLCTLQKHFSTFFVAFQRAKTGDFRRWRVLDACIFLQGLYNKQYVPCARANVVFYGHSVERKERNFGYGCNFQGM